MNIQIDSLRWFPNVVAQRHISGMRTQGTMTPNSNSADIFVQWTYPPPVSSSHVYSFKSYRVDKQINTQTPLKTSNALRYATTLGKYQQLISTETLIIPAKVKVDKLRDETGEQSEYCRWIEVSSVISILEHTANEPLKETSIDNERSSILTGLLL